jgi:chemotaxis protein MotB
MTALARRRRRGVDIWPGFVDALATLVMVIVFVLMIFTLFQFHLKDVISGRDLELAQLSQRIGALADQLAMEQRAALDLREQLGLLNTELAALLGTRERLEQELAAADNRVRQVEGRLEDAFKSIAADKEKIDVQLRELDALRRNIETLTILRDQLQRDLNARSLEAQASAEATAAERARAAEALAAERDRAAAALAAERARAAEALAAERARGGDALAAERQLSADAQARVDLLTRQINALQQQLGRLEAALDASELKSKEQQTQIVDLGRRLNLALASKVEELARYRSEFFGKVSEALGARGDVRIVGDRFIFQAEVLFEPGSATLDPQGRAQISRVGQALTDIAQRIPTEISWVLQVEGHTDRRPINTPQFPSNWELSTSRAISVLRALQAEGIPANRLAAAGFAEFQPLDARDDEIALRRNRRIELKLTSR